MVLKEVNWGFIGCGNVTEIKSGPAFNKIPHSKVIGVMRRNACLANDYASRHGIPNVYTNVDELLQNSHINAIYIATPPQMHAQYAIKAMRAGKPVYVEKPMARTYQECQAMIRCSNETGMPIFVAYYRRTLPMFLKIKEIIDNQLIGDVESVNITLHKSFVDKDKIPENRTWHVQPEISGGGYFYDLACHQFDFLDFVFGEIIDANGKAFNIKGLYNAEDTVSATFQFQSGIIGKGSWSFVVEKEEESDNIEIIGNKGRVSFPCFAVGSLMLETNLNKEYFEFVNPKNISYNLVEQVVESLIEGKSCVSTGISAARTNAVMEKIIYGKILNKKF